MAKLQIHRYAVLNPYGVGFLEWNGKAMKVS
jgi:hypothetical protein